MAILRILVIVAVLLAICNLAEMKNSKTLKPISNRAHKRALILERANGLEGSYKNTSNGPSLASDSLSFVEGGNVKCANVLENDQHYDNTTLMIHDAAHHGTAYVDGARACYVPDPEFNGHDSFTYSVCDKKGMCASAIVRVQVSAVNDAPTVRDDTAVVEEDEYSVLIDVLRNDEDVDGRYVNFASLRVVQKPCHGTAVVTRDHKILYTPSWNEDTRYFGEDEFIYQICDNEDPNLCSHATVEIEVKDKCIACEKCNDLLQTFNDQREAIHKVFEETILSDL